MTGFELFIYCFTTFVFSIPMGIFIRVLFPHFHRK